MINADSVKAVAAGRFGEHFLRPRYDAYGFARIPQTIRACLVAGEQPGVDFGPRQDLYQQYDAVILLFVDAFGWRFFEQYAGSSPFLRRIADEGLVCKLSSQFPSTTAAHVTAIHTGLPVGRSGVYEWYYYEPLLDALIAPLLYSFAGDTRRNTLARTNIGPQALYPTRTLYQDLRRHAVESVVLQHKAYALTPFSNVVTDGARVVAYHTLPEALVSLAGLLARQRAPTYYFVYIDSIDAIGHHYGPESPQFAAEIEVFLATMELVLHPALGQAHRRTLLLLTADHGQVAIDPATTVYLNREIPELEAYLKLNRSGQLLVPAGSCRDMFLHVKEQYLDEARALLSRKLAGRAEVYSVRDLIDQGFFGAEAPAPEFMGRVGDLVILPYAGEAVWWYEKDVFEQRFYGSHGGLTPQEMETLLLALPYG
jgi:predicted AlkP superfamily pyrophosphatase or phosphodiesterase